MDIQKIINIAVTSEYEKLLKKMLSDNGFRYIVRDKFNGLSACKIKPTQLSIVWYIGATRESIFHLDPSLFLHVRWEDYEPYEIRERDVL